MDEPNPISEIRFGQFGTELPEFSALNICDSTAHKQSHNMVENTIKNTNIVLETLSSSSYSATGYPKGARAMDPKLGSM